jgi:hypothetical protein
LATFERRLGKAGKTWRVRVRRGNGPKLTKSFPRKADAEEWARSIEHKLDVGEHVPNSEARKRTLGDAIDRYLESTLPHARHRKNASEQTRLLGWWKAQHSERALVGLTPSVLSEARDALPAGTLTPALLSALDHGTERGLLTSPVVVVLREALQSGLNASPPSDDRPRLRIVQGERKAA